MFHLLAAQQPQQQGSIWPMLIMMVAIFAIMWLFMIRPQQQKQKKIREFQNALQEGSKVVVSGGIYGTVKRIDTSANIIEVEVAKGTVIRVDRNYVFADATSQMQNGQAAS